MCNHTPQSPDTIPRTPPSGLARALIRPHLTMWTTVESTWALAKFSPNRNRKCTDRISPRSGRRCSHVMPDGLPLPATPLRADRRFLPNNFVQIEVRNWLVLHDLARECLVGLSCNWSNTALVPGATSLPSKTCRAKESSPTCTILSALVTRALHVITTSSTTLPDLANGSHLVACSTGREEYPLPSQEIFETGHHLRSWDQPSTRGSVEHLLSFFTTSAWQVSHAASSNANFSAFRKGPRKTLHHRCSLVKHCTRIGVVQ